MLNRSETNPNPPPTPSHPTLTTSSRHNPSADIDFPSASSFSNGLAGRGRGRRRRWGLSALCGCLRSAEALVIGRDKDKNSVNKQDYQHNVITAVSKTGNSGTIEWEEISTEELRRQAAALRDPFQLPFLGKALRVTEGMKTLVLDLDETLVHSSFRPVSVYAFVIPVEIEGRLHDIYVCKRPGIDEFLEAMYLCFEIVVFTASLAKYADPLMDLLDPGKLCSWRLFRECCTIINGCYIKDLSRLGRDLKNVIIIDNSPNSYALQPENAIPIKSWFDDITDRELSDLIPILEALSRVDDIPTVMRQTLAYENYGIEEEADEARQYSG